MRTFLNTPKLAFCLCGLALGLGGGTARSFTISGQITDSTNGSTFFGVSGVTVTAKPGISQTGPSAVTDAGGNYTITNLTIGVYGVTPVKAGVTFSPAGELVVTSLNINNPSGVDFSVAHSISGQVTVGGNGLSGTFVTAGGQSGTTDASGNYTITGVPAGT